MRIVFEIKTFGEVFYLSQSTMRKVNECGLKPLDGCNQSSAIDIKMLLSLCFLLEQGVLEVALVGADLLSNSKEYNKPIENIVVDNLERELTNNYYFIFLFLYPQAIYNQLYSKDYKLYRKNYFFDVSIQLFGNFHRQKATVTTYKLLAAFNGSTRPRTGYLHISSRVQTYD